MNIAKILKYCPKGTKLYSTVHGEVTLHKVYDECLIPYPIYIDVINSTKRESFTKEGQLYEDKGECVLFPSKNQKDWNKFRIPVNKGDFIVTRDNLPYIVDKYEGNRVKIICGIHQSKAFLDASSSNWYIVKDYIPAPLNVKLELLDIIKANGFIWNANTLQLIFSKSIVAKTGKVLFYKITEGIYSYSTECKLKRAFASDTEECKVEFFNIIKNEFFLDSVSLNLHPNAVLVKCIIPEGSIYFINECGEIVSNQIILTKVAKL